MADAVKQDDILDLDPLRNDPQVADFFGDRYESVRDFADQLALQGERRGLIGPRELTRIWDRHIINSAAIAPFLGDEGTIVDVGSGAGLPGLVIAAMLPEREVVLIEPMERRCQWLQEMADYLNLNQAKVVRGRAEELAGRISATYLTARAVASIDKLVKWTLPLLATDGQMTLLKGRAAAQEVDKAKYVLRKAGLVARISSSQPVSAAEPTTVVELMRERKDGEA